MPLVNGESVEPLDAESVIHLGERRRQYGERRLLDEPLAFERMVGELLVEFTNLHAEDVDAAITRAQHRVADAADVDGIAVFELSTTMSRSPMHGRVSPTNHQRASRRRASRFPGRMRTPGRAHSPASPRSMRSPRRASATPSTAAERDPASSCRSRSTGTPQVRSALPRHVTGASGRRRCSIASS
jgi:hypothetical protein